MPDLFTHEISCPEDRAMRKFLWYGALHDSTILSASTTGRRGNGLILRVDHGVLHGIARPGIYQLHFHGVTHTEYAGNPFSGSETIYDTLFLDSALLHAEQAVCPRRRLYHLRITTWAGFIDVVFASFSIRLDGGHVDYRLPEISDETLAAQRESWIRQAYTAARQELVLCQADVSDRDLDEYHATGLWIAHTDGAPHHAAELARQTLLQPLTQSLAWQYAAFVLGLHGDQQDLLPLTRLLLALPPHQCLSRRIVMDALQRIRERSGSGIQEGNSVVVSMRDDNGLGCSYAIVSKESRSVLILLRDAVCAVFPLREPHSLYLLLKHYPDDRAALRDFYKLIGKMSAKPAHSKYFGTRLPEDNRMLVTADGGEHMLTAAEASRYDAQQADFLTFTQSIRLSLAQQ